MDQKKKKKQVSGKPTRTLDSVKDERFAHIIKNPVYRPVPKREKKVEIDKRFQAMFNDDKFKLKYKVDKRGRPVETTTDENLKRYYNLAAEDSDGDEEGEKIQSKKRSSKTTQLNNDEDDRDSSEEESIDSSEDEREKKEESDIDGDVKEDEITSPLKTKGKTKIDEATRKKLHSADIDYARGEANFMEESSSDYDSSSDENEEEASMVHDWGEMDKDADRTEESSRRLALCNMDWDRVRAVDLMVLLGSFLPTGGIIRSVTIYPSQFGKERMAEEETQGPRELRENGDNPEIKMEKLSDSEEDESDEEGEGSQYHREKLRQYQLNRLKYYYAVAEFDCSQTAEKVYAECDGMEYESSAAKVDLRFVPDDMEFEDEPKDICTNLPDGTKYRPRFFTTTALQQVKVDLTWDETDPLRKELTEKIFDPKEKVDDDDIRAYLATSSEEESEDEAALPEDEIKQEDITDDESQEKSEKKIKEPKRDKIYMYKALLQSIETTEKKKKEKDMEMEITWGVGLKETTEKLVKKKMEEVEKSKRTPWEEMLDKRKEKRRSRKQEKKKANTSDGNESSDNSEDMKDEGQMFSDDDVDVDMSDEFFQSELRENEIFKQAGGKSKHKNEGKKKKNQNELNDKDEKKKVKTAAELELLLMDEDDNKRHFSLKKIIAEENETKSKNKRKNKKRKLNEMQNADKHKDDFDIDVQDNRFGALFNSHHFNIDPSDPNYKKTKAMDKIIAEKHKRRAEGKLAKERNDLETEESTNLKINEEIMPSARDASTLNKKADNYKKAELSYLVKSVKRNTENLKSKKKF